MISSKLDNSDNFHVFRYILSGLKNTNGKLESFFPTELFNQDWFNLGGNQDVS